jgi:ketosteroid isomerase-like protein
MSRENVEIVRRYIWAFENDLDTFRELTHPAIEWAPFEENHSIFRGVDGALRVRTGWLETWTEHRIEIEEIVDGGDEVVASVHLIGRGRGSGVEVDVRLYLHVKVRDGKVAYVYEHENRVDALRAAGLE